MNFLHNLFQKVKTALIIILISMSSINAQQSEYDKLINQGNEFVKFGQFEEAEEVFEQAVDLDENNILAYLALGDLYYLQKEWGNAKDQYYEALELQPQHLYARYRLAICYREHGRTRDPAFRMIMWHKAEKHFVKITETDSTYQEVFNEFAYLKRYQDDYKEAIDLCLKQMRIHPLANKPRQDIFMFYDFYLAHGEGGVFGGFGDVDRAQINWLQGRTMDYDMLFLGEKYRRVDNFAKADSVLSALLKRKLTISKVPVYLSRVRLYYQMGLDVQAEKDYWRALESIREFYELKFIFDDTKYILNDSDLQVHFPNLQKIRTYYRQFWNKRNLFPGSEVNLRLAEHYRRLAYAEKAYRYDGLKLAIHSPDVNLVLNFPRVFYLNHFFNDRGLVYVRYGPPDDTAISLGADMLNNESWLYYQTSLNPKLIFHFEVNHNANSSDWRLVPVPTNRNMIESRLGWDRNLDQYYMAQTGLEQNAALSEVQINAEKTIKKAMAKDRPISMREVIPISLFITTSRFMDEVGETYLDVSLSAQKTTLLNKDFECNNCVFEVGFAVQDTLWNIIDRKTKHIQVSSDNDSIFTEGNYIDIFKVFSDRNKIYLSGHIKSMDSTGIGGYKFLYDFETIPKNGLAASDLVLAYDIKPSVVVDKFTHHGMRVTPNPQKKFDKSKLVHLYYELYNLQVKDGTAEYTVEQIVQPRSGEKGIFSKFMDIFSSDESKEISITKDQQSTTSTTGEFTAFDFNEWDTGPIDIIIVITDKNSGESVSISSGFELY